MTLLQLALAFVDLGQDTSVDVVLQANELGGFLDERRSSDECKIF